MLVMEKDNELYLFPDCELSYMVSKGYELKKLIRVKDRCLLTHPASKGKKLIDYIDNQKRLLKQLEDHYQRKSKERKNAIKMLEELKND